MRSKTSKHPISYVFFIPLWQRGIKGDFKKVLGKSPPAYRQAGSPLPWSGLVDFAKEGYERSLVSLEPITEGLQIQNVSPHSHGVEATSVALWKRRLKPPLPLEPRVSEGILQNKNS